MLSYVAIAKFLYISVEKFSIFSHNLSHLITTSYTRSLITISVDGCDAPHRDLRAI